MNVGTGQTLVTHRTGTAFTWLSGAIGQFLAIEASMPRVLTLQRRGKRVSAAFDVAVFVIRKSPQPWDSTGRATVKYRASERLLRSVG